jgi:hypothetical protein
MGRGWKMNDFFADLATYAWILLVEHPEWEGVTPW